MVVSQIHHQTTNSVLQHIGKGEETKTRSKGKIREGGGGAPTRRQAAHAGESRLSVLRDERSERI